MPIIVVLWRLGLVYWLIAARRGKPIERQAGSWSRLTHHPPLVLGAVFIAVLNFLGGWLEGFFRREIELFVEGNVVAHNFAIFWSRPRGAGHSLAHSHFGEELPLFRQSCIIYQHFVKVVL
jgi:hypothetical protein